jgi:hypothetical protein
MSDERTLLVGLLTKQMNKTEDEVTALLYDKDGENLKLKDGVADTLYSFDAERVNKLKAAQTEKFNDGYKKAQGEILTKYEQQIREKYGVQTDKTGVDLIEDIIAAKAPARSAAKLTDDDVKKHEAYIALERGKIKEYEDKINAILDEHNQYKSGVEREKKLSVVYDRANGELDKMRPVMAKSPEVARNQRKMFLNMLNDYDYDIGDNGIVVLKDGKRVENKHGHAVSFEDIVKEKAATMFEFEQQSAKGGAGNQNNGGSSASYSGQLPKDMAELAKFAADIEADGTLSAEEKAKKKVEMTRAFAAAQNRPL